MGPKEFEAQQIQSQLGEVAKLANMLDSEAHELQNTQKELESALTSIRNRLTSCRTIQAGIFRHLEEITNLLNQSVEDSKGEQYVETLATK